MSPPSSSRQNELTTATKNNHGFWYNVFVGPGGAATLAGLCEVLIFHPFDTTAKRLMSYHHRVVDPASFRATMANLEQVVFATLKAEYRDPVTGAMRSIPWTARVQHLYPGSSYAVAYKVLQRTLKFAGQPYMRDYLHVHHSSLFFRRDTATGEYIRGGRGALMLEATAGCLVGASEVILLPFDRMKVLNQTNRAAVESQGLLSVIRTAGISKLYAGALTTMVRNTTGSFLLFGGTAFTKEYVFHLEKYSDATFLQNIVASTVGGCIGVFCTSPMDVIKTRIQSQNLSEKMSGWRVLRTTVQREGVSAFFKGITPKIATAAPRLVFSYTMTQYFTKWLRGES